jgi:hypothetical protein
MKSVGMVAKTPHHKGRSGRGTTCQEGAEPTVVTADIPLGHPQWQEIGFRWAGILGKNVPGTVTVTPSASTSREVDHWGSLNHLKLTVNKKDNQGIFC